MAYIPPHDYRGTIKRANALIHQAKIQMGQIDENGNHMVVLFASELQKCLVECSSFHKELEFCICALKANNPRFHEYKQALNDLETCIKELKVLLL